MKTHILQTQRPLSWTELKKKLKLSNAAKAVVFIDKNVKAKEWTKSYDLVLPVHAGEKIKTLKSAEKLLSQIVDSKISTSRENLYFIGVGGGSVGDAVGFLASIYKRGVPLIHMPTTWLSALDSAHGGKTALNFSGAKNQVGTFYNAKAVVIVEDFLKALPEKNKKQAAGEFYKTALLSGGRLLKDFENAAELSEEKLFSILMPGIQYKYKIVAQDPFESKGLRHILNFGHTIGHVLESELKLPHGEAVALGCRFAVAWSYHKKLMSAENTQRALKLWDDVWGYKEWQTATQRKISWRRWEAALNKDKKATSKNQLRFVFIKAPGQPVVKTVSISEIRRELLRQGLM